MTRVLRPVKLFVALCDAGRELPELLTIQPELDGIAPSPSCLLTPEPERLYGTLELLLGNGPVRLHRGSYLLPRGGLRRHLDAATAVLAKDQQRTVRQSGQFAVVGQIVCDVGAKDFRCSRKISANHPCEVFAIPNAIPAPCRMLVANDQGVFVENFKVVERFHFSLRVKPAEVR